VQGKSGYNLIELAAILVITGFLSVMVFAAINNASSNSQLNTAANKLASDLRYAQSMAAGNAVWYGVTFEVTANRYRLYTTTGTADTAADDPAKFGSNFIVYVATSFAVTINSATIESASNRKVEFSPLGTPYTDKTLAALTTEGVVTLKKGTQTKTVRITPNTGRVYVQ
jgi:Tfp pilus assembly protein FimT